MVAASALTGWKAADSALLGLGWVAITTWTTATANAIANATDGYLRRTMTSAASTRLSAMSPAWLAASDEWNEKLANTFAPTASRPSASTPSVSIGWRRNHA